MLTYNEFADKKAKNDSKFEDKFPRNILFSVAYTVHDRISLWSYLTWSLFRGRFRFEARIGVVFVDRWSLCESGR